VAKWLATQPKVIILDEPTKGIDIGSKAAVHAFMRELAAEGLAVIMVSSEIPEVLGMSDRVFVMRAGRKVAEYDRDSATMYYSVLPSLFWWALCRYVSRALQRQGRLRVYSMTVRY